MNSKKKQILMSIKKRAVNPVPVLQSVQAEGRLDGLFFEVNVRQVYRNTSPDVLEVVYTFPLAMGAVLLGLRVELGGKTLSGVVVERMQAEARYEAAMASGDAPIMLERTGDGMYTVNLGNIKPGEDLVVAYRYAQLLHYEQDQVRLCIPTTIAPRYGDPFAHGRLQPHQVPAASLTAEYPFLLDLTFEGAWKGAEIACATHTGSTKAGAASTVLHLGQRAWLDRDVVVTLRGAPQASFARSVWDDDQHVIAATFQPAKSSDVVDRMDVKLLVDCSGSMEGDSIESAKAALACVADQLSENDRFSFTRFGSNVVHGFRCLTPARPSNLAMLHALIKRTNAKMGGTEMQSALSSTITLDDTGECADILLITDGEVWNVDPMIAEAAASRHRIFLVGVGAAPAESTLRRLAEATGGACEFATPGENLRVAIERMFSRIRQQPRGAARVVWRQGGETLKPDWIAGLPSAVFGGDTVHVFAGFSGAAPTSARLVHDTLNGEWETSATAHVEPRVSAGNSMARMAGAARLAQASDTEALAVALRYQLVSDKTNFIVVHERAAGEKVEDMAELHTVPSMLAARWGASSSLMIGACAEDGGTRGPSVMMAYDVDYPGAPLASRLALFKKRRASAEVKHIDKDALLQLALGILAVDPSAKLANVLDQQTLGQSVKECLDDLLKTGLDRETAWAVLVRWLAELGTVQMMTAIEQELESRLALVSSAQWRDAVLALARLAPAADMTL